MGNVLEVGVDVRLDEAVLCLRQLEEEPELEQAIKNLMVHFEACSKLYFIRVELSKLPEFCGSALGRRLSLLEGAVSCVGSGAWRLEGALKQLFPRANFQRNREAPCLLAGLSVFANPLFRYVPDRQSWDMGAPDDLGGVQTESASLPLETYLLVTMKSGCSFFRVSQGEQFVTRIGGSSLGGCTFKSLMDALLPSEPREDPDQAKTPGELGESLDLTVGDIYGGEEVPASLNLPSHIIASVFGKARTKTSAKATSRSICNLVAINTAQLAFLHATLMGCNKIVFAFIQGREVQYRMNKFLQFWSKGTIQTVFCNHADLLASAGTLVLPGDSTTYEEHRFDETCTSLQLSADDHFETD